MLLRIARVDPGRDPRKVTLTFSVVDTGIGIAQDQQQRIFQAFNQADASTTRRFGGTGLGLTISSQLVALMGGKLSLSSAAGLGSNFQFTVDFEAQPTRSESVPALSRLRVLVVEDNDTAREVLSDIVDSLGWTVETAPSAAAAIALLEMREAVAAFDLLLLDWTMPGVDGLEVARWLRSRHAPGTGPIVIVATAYSREHLLSESLPGAYDGILVKPITASALFNAVGIARRQRSELRIGLARSPQARRLEGLSLLVVDDSEVNRDVAAGILAFEGATVTLAGDGLAALSLLEKQPDAFQAVLMDMQMPVLDGYEATRRIRSTPALASVPVIALTAGAFSSQRALAMQAGVDDFIAKPFNVQQLVDTLLRLGRRAGAHAGASPPAAAMEPPVQRNDMLFDEAFGLQVWRTPSALAASLQKFLKLHDGDITSMQAASPAQRASLAHRLKGSAAQLGMVALADRAQAVEREGKAGDATAASMERLHDAMLRTRAVIVDYIDTHRAATPPPLARAGDAAPLQGVADLRRALASDDVDRIDAALEACSTTLSPDGLSRVRDAIANYDFRGAEALLREAVSRTDRATSQQE